MAGCDNTENTHARQHKTLHNVAENGLEFSPSPFMNNILRYGSN
jgi:hypothetical protein